MTRYRWPAVRGGSGDDPSGRAEFVRAYRAAAPEVQESAVARRRSLLAARRVREAGPERLAPAAANADMWVPVGPTSVLRGQTQFTPRVSGRIRDIAVSDDGERVYAATANGGVWYSSDAGTSWLPVGAWATAVLPELTMGATPLTCGCLLVDFGADAGGADDDVFVGTGEILPFSEGYPGGRLGGVGVLFSHGPVPKALARPLENPWEREGKNLSGFGIFRLAFHPDNHGRIVAATSHGLWTRTGEPVVDSEWEKVEATPFGEAETHLDFSRFLCTDVAWVGESVARLYVCVNDTGGLFHHDDSGLWVSDNNVDGPFRLVDLPGREPYSRFGIAVASKNKRVLYVLGKGPHLWRVQASANINDIEAHDVGQVPLRLFGLGGLEASSYDLAIAVDPENADRVALGGSIAVAGDNTYSAALFRCGVQQDGAGYKLDYKIAKPLDEFDETKQTTDPTFIGEGIHADVHQILWKTVDGRHDMWVTCDGGVFRSRADGDRGSFTARNTGIASLEAGFVAGHPTNDVAMITGTQDNGVLRRVGDTLWEVALVGDGGGVAYHPTDFQRFVGQYSRSVWYDELGNELRMARRSLGELTDSESTEKYASGFYSGVAVRATTAGDIRLAIGTIRVWLSPDFGTKWTTLPSNKDPRRATSATSYRQNWKDDVPFVGSSAYPPPAAQVVALRWIDDDRLLVLCRGGVFLIETDDGVEWRRTLITRYEQPSCATLDPDEVTSPAKALMPIGRWSDIASHVGGVAGCGSFYVTTTGPPRGETPAQAQHADTLWWFDGIDKWYATGLRSAGGGVPAPAYAVAVHPWQQEFVFVGTSVGVWRGQLRNGPNGPIWDWSPFVNGLPEAAVQDLSFFERSGAQSMLLLRAALQARGVWEVDLTQDLEPRTYLRVHRYDSRRVTPTVMPVLADGLGDPAEFVWNQSPDVRARTAPGSPPPPAPTGLPWTRSSFPEEMRSELWLFQVALRHYLAAELQMDPLVRANGEWTTVVDEQVKAARAAPPALPGPGNAMIDDALWARVVAPPHVYADPWDSATPTEADLAELIVDRLPWVTFEAGSNIVSGPARFDVLVHHRHGRAALESDVYVTVVSAALAASPADWAAMPVPWTGTVVDLLRNNGMPPPGWTQPAAPWMVGGGNVPSRTPSGPLFRRPTGPVDPRTPRAVTFDLDFTGAPPFSTWVVVAVVHSAPDPVALFSTTLQELALNNWHVAVRTVETSS
ncbi:MAG TPA: hypothetical protein VH912_24540 [Streptosporangiaceae bacterium]|jgi:hypothetical protein